MKTDQKALATFLSAAIWADGVISDEELELVKEIQEELELENLESDVKATLDQLNKMDDDAFDEALENASELVDPKENEVILDLCLEIMCADGYLALEEVKNHCAFAELLGIDEERAMDIMNDFIDETEDLIVEEHHEPELD